MPGDRASDHFYHFKWFAAEMVPESLKRLNPFDSVVSENG